MKKLIALKSFVVSAALVCGAVAAFASPKNIEVVSRGDDGSFMLRLPASEIDLQLYYATSGENDPWVVDASHWRNPHFIQDVTAGTTDLMVTLPPVHAADAVCFFLADPARATVRRVSYLIGGKDDNGKFNSAFLTGLHPDRDWRYEIAFAVPGFQLGQGWLLCHRDGAANKNSRLLLAVRGANGNDNDKRMRFGYGDKDNGDNVQTTKQISENVIYQASINGNVCVYSNLTEDVEFERVQAPATTTAYKRFDLCFGAAVNGRAFAESDGCSFSQVYSFKAWNGNGELMADYRPVVQGSNAGFFDLVTKTLFRSGDGFAVAFTPYVAAEDDLPVDTLVEHLGELVAVSPEPMLAGDVKCVSESLPFSAAMLPAYGLYNVAEDESITFDLPTEEFVWANEVTKETYRVRSAGLRIDTQDPQTGAWVKGVPHHELTSYTYTRAGDGGGVRVVCLWDAELLMDAPEGLRASCLRLVSVGTGASGKTEVGHGLFDTGVHPIPATTRVLMDVSFDTDGSSVSSQNALSPSGSRRFFGVRDQGAHGSGDNKCKYNFQLTRTDASKIRVDFCNYMDGFGPESDGVTFGILNATRYRFDVNPTYVTCVREGDNVEHIGELKNVSVARSTEPLNGKLYIFGSERGDDAKAPLCVDYNNTRYYSFAIWQDGVTLTRDYVPCVDSESKPAFYDRVNRNYIYPIGDKAIYEAEFGKELPQCSVRVLGENEKGEMAAYFDPDATQPGFYEIPSGESQAFTATGRKVFGRRVVGYRIDTWTDDGWVKGSVQSGRSVVLDGEDSVRRLVWIWKKMTGMILLVD